MYSCGVARDVGTKVFRQNTNKLEMLREVRSRQISQLRKGFTLHVVLLSSAVLIFALIGWMWSRNLTIDTPEKVRMIIYVVSSYSTLVQAKCIPCFLQMSHHTFPSGFDAG